MSSVGTGVELAANVKALLALTSSRQSAESSGKQQAVSDIVLLAQPVAPPVSPQRVARLTNPERVASRASELVQGHRFADIADRAAKSNGSNISNGKAREQQTLSWYRKLALPSSADAGTATTIGDQVAAKPNATVAAPESGKQQQQQQQQKTITKSKTRNRKSKRSSSFIGHASSNLVNKLMYMIKKSNTLTSEFGATTGTSGRAAPAPPASGQQQAVVGSGGSINNNTTKASSLTATATAAPTATAAANVDGSLAACERSNGAAVRTGASYAANNRYRLSELGRRFFRRCKQSKAVQFATRNIRKKLAATAATSGLSSAAGANATAPQRPTTKTASTTANDKCLASKASLGGESGGGDGDDDNDFDDAGLAASSVALQSAKRTEQAGDQAGGTSSSEEVFPLAGEASSGNPSGTSSNIMNLATSLATVTNRFHCSASVGNLLSSYGGGAGSNGGQQQRRELAELSGDSHLGGIKPLDYVPRGPFDQYDEDDDRPPGTENLTSSNTGSAGGSSRGSSSNNIKDQALAPPTGRSQQGSQSCTKSQYLAVDNHSTGGSASVSRKSSAKEKRNKQKDAERVEKLRLLVSYLKSGTSQPLLAPVTLDSEEIELAQKYKQHMILCEFCLQGAEQQLEQQKAVRPSASSGQLQSSNATNNHDHQPSISQSNHLNNHLTTSHNLNDQLTNHHHHHHHCCNHLHPLNQNHDQSSPVPTDQGSASSGGDGGLTMSAGPAAACQNRSPAPEVAMENSGANTNQGSTDEVDQSKTFLSSCRSVPQNLATWIDNEVNSLVHDLEAQSQLLVRNEKHAQSSGGKRKWLSSSNRRNSSGALST